MTAVRFVAGLFVLVAATIILALGYTLSGLAGVFRRRREDEEWCRRAFAGTVERLDIPTEPRRRCSDCGMAPIYSTAMVGEAGLENAEAGGWVECSAEPGTYHLPMEVAR